MFKKYFILIFKYLNTADFIPVSVSRKCDHLLDSLKEALLFSLITYSL